MDGDAGNYTQYAGNVETVYSYPLSLGGASNSHYNGNAETYMNIGQAMGQEMAGIFKYRPFLEVDRQTGEMKIVNPFYGDAQLHINIDLTDYEITSDAGSLNGANWTTIAANYDADNGGAVDADDLWAVTSSGLTTLSEGTTGGDGGAILIGNEVSLGVGTWLVNPIEDLRFTYTDGNGNIQPLAVRFTGNPIVVGDYDGDGLVDADDWAVFVAGAQQDMAALSLAQQYRMGDLDGDGDNDIYDFDLFRTAFEADHPAPGAFSAMLAEYYSIPEPGSALLLLGGAAGLALRRRKPASGRAATPQRPAMAGNRAGLLAGLALIVCVGSANALTVLSDDFEVPDVTAAQSDGNTSGAINTANWVRATQGFGSTRQGTVDEAHGDFTDPVGEQAYAFRYTNSGITTAEGVIGILTTGYTYSISFDVVMDGHNNTTPYDADLFAWNPGAARNDVRADSFGTRLAGVSGNATTDGLYSTISFSYTTVSVPRSGEFQWFGLFMAQRSGRN